MGMFWKVGPFYVLKLSFVEDIQQSYGPIGHKEIKPQKTIDIPYQHEICYSACIQLGWHYAFFQLIENHLMALVLSVDV